MLGQSFTPCGEPLSSHGGGASRYGYTGEWTDGTGLVHLRARYMAPTLGRFLSRDTWAGDYQQPLSYNRWLYANSQPINNIDPTGLCPYDFWGWDETSGLFTDENCKTLDKDTAPYKFTKQWYTKLADQMRKDGLKQAATNMEHFIGGSGTDLILPSSWVRQTVTTGMPNVQKDIDKLLKWWVRRYFDSLETCEETPIVPGEVLSTTWGMPVKTDLWGASSKNSSTKYKDAAAALGKYRVDVEIGGNLHRIDGGFWSSDYVDANLQVRVVIMDVYDWNPDDRALYPNRENWIPGEWSYRLDKYQGNPNGYLSYGEYTYTVNLTGVKKGWFLSSNPPKPWFVTSCIGSGFDIDTPGGSGTTDYCDYKDYERITPP